MATTKAIKEIKKLKEKYNINDDLCLKLVAAYADKVSEWAETPSLPGSMPVLFSDYVSELVNKGQNGSQEQAETPAPRPAESPVVKSEVHVNKPKQKEISNNAYKFDFKASEDELDMHSNCVGLPNTVAEEMKALWEKIYPLGDTGMKVKLTVVTGYKNAVIPQLLDTSGMAVKRLKPRVDGLLGQYVFVYNDKTITFVLE